MADARPGQKPILITRVFDAPPELVWKAWTDPKHLVRWWGPKTFTSPSCSVDFRVGGKYLFCMRSPEGKDYWSTGTYREIVPLHRIVYTDNFADEHGTIVPPSFYDFPDENWAGELLVTLTFEAFEGKTTMNLRHEGFPDAHHIKLAFLGWNESLDKLDQSIH